MNNLFAGFLKFIVRTKLRGRGIPGDTSLAEYMRVFSARLAKCHDVLRALDSGDDFASPRVQEILNDGEIRTVFGTILSAYAFKRITSLRFVEMANAIINTTSCVASISQLFGGGADLESIATEAADLANTYTAKTGVTPGEISKFEIFDCVSLFTEYLRCAAELRKTLQEKTDQLEKAKLATFVCYNCTERPAISALLPCGHAFLCCECLSDAVNSGLTHRCYVCKREIHKVIRLQFNLQ